MYKCMRCGKICDDTDYYHTCNPGCVWKPVNNTNFYHIECRDILIEKVSDKEYDWGFCPYCGRPIYNE